MFVDLHLICNLLTKRFSPAQIYRLPLTLLVVQLAMLSSGPKSGLNGHLVAQFVAVFECSLGIIPNNPLKIQVI